jgi:hypothetical protein
MDSLRGVEPRSTGIGDQSLKAVRTGSEREPRGTRTLAHRFAGDAPHPEDRFSAVESARIELASPGCRPGALPLSYDPAGCEGIEPSLRVLEARPVTMTLQPIGVFAARRGVEPLSHRRRRHCDTGRITGRTAKLGGGRGSNPPPQVHGLPSSPDEYRHHATEPPPGVEPDLPAYGAGARPHEPRGRAAGSSGRNRTFE